MRNDLRSALTRPSFYPGSVSEILVRETHISWVFLAGERAYKLKKPLKLSFLDYSTPRRRLRMCRAEVKLNTPAAPDIYLGVRAVAERDDGRLELADADDDAAVDYLVEMRRYDESRTMAEKLARGELSSADVALAARALAEFHARASHVSAAGQPGIVAKRLKQNLSELLKIVEATPELRRVLALERFVDAWLASHRETLEARALEGYVRELHGDLRAEHVLLEPHGRVSLLDCIEFDAGLRRIDVSDDLAFLLMDLSARAGEQYARSLLSTYRRAGGNPGDQGLIAFYACNHALVRAKVALLRARQADSASAQHNAVARELLCLAERFSWQARLPATLVLCGLPAAGKSTLATALSRAAGVPLVQSDATRKSLAGLTPTERAPLTLYSQEWDERTYAELAQTARKLAAREGAVIVDATFRRRTQRKTFVHAVGAERVLFVECRTPRTTRLRRARQRQREPDRISDATPKLIDGDAIGWQPLDELAPATRVSLCTHNGLEHQLEELAALLDQRMSLAAESRRQAHKGTRTPPRT